MGDGSQRPALEESAAGIHRLRFLPIQPENELPNVLGAADVLLVSERSSVIDMSLPSKLTSYFAAARPVVAAVPAAGATAREVLRAGAGVVVPVGDADELVDAVAHLGADTARSDALGRAGRAYAKSSLDPALAAARMDGLLERTLGAANAARRR
jgi:glycosyltransferase involved in cell wall biosynthesis